jgi:hypothetical protein
VLYKNTPTSEYTDTTNLITVFCRILGKVRHIDAWAADKNFLYVSDHVQHDDMTSAPYTRKIIINHTKLRNANDNGEAEYFTCKQVLVAMLTNLQARLMQYHGAWWVIPVAKSNADLTAYAYFKNGDNGNNSTADTPSFVTQSAGNLYSLSTAITSANKTKLTGFEFGALPSLSQVNYPHNYEGHAYDWNGIGPGNNAGDITGEFVFANGAPVLEDNDVVSLTFSYVVSFTGYGTDASSDRGRRVRIAFKVRHGDIYARRNATAMTDGASAVVTNTYTTNGDNMECFVVSNTAPLYSTSTSNEIQEFTAVYDRFAGAHLTGTVTITFPPIDVDLGTVDITEVGEFDIKVFDKDNNDVTTADASLGQSFALANITSIYQTRGGSTFDGDTITYSRTNAAGNARESLNLPAAMLADKVGTSNPNQGVWLINEDGVFVLGTGDWSNSTYPSVSTPICDLTCLDILSMRQTPITTATGTVRFPNNLYGPLFAVQGLDSDLEYYVPLRLRMNANDALYEGEWFKYQYDNSTSTLESDDSVPVPGSVPNVAIGFRRNRMTLNTLEQAMSEATMRLSNELQAASNDLALLSNDVSDLQQAGAGYSGPIPLANISGRWVWTSADDGERIITGDSVYGPFNYFQHDNELGNTNLKIYSAAHVIDSTNGTMASWGLFMGGIRMPTSEKKVRVDYAFKLQNAGTGTTWGFSVWSSDLPSSSPDNGTVTVTLRGESGTETSQNNSSDFHFGSFTTTSKITEDYIIVQAENRSGSLTTTTYIYGQYSVYLVD